MCASAPFQELVVEILSELAPERCTAAPGVASWVEAVATWNRQMDLTAARDDRELVDLMVADAALLASALSVVEGPTRCRAVDVGAGAGAPGLPLALLRTDLDVTLVEPKQKRAALLRTTLGRLGCRPPRPGVQASGMHGSVEVVQARGEAVQGFFDVALSRATLSPTNWLKLGTKLAPAGEVWVLLAREPAPASSDWRQLDELEYRWPLTGVERRAACYQPR